jgi:hypothetical protein
VAGDVKEQQVVAPPVAEEALDLFLELLRGRSTSRLTSNSPIEPSSNTSASASTSAVSARSAASPGSEYARVTTSSARRRPGVVVSVMEERADPTAQLSSMWLPVVQPARRSSVDASTAAARGARWALPQVSIAR